jgi:hypothetical protein
MDTSKFHIIDNFLSDNAFKNLTELVLKDKLPWFFGEQTSINPNDNFMTIDPLAVETWGFYHSIYERQENKASFAYPYFEELFSRIEEVFGITRQQLIRARLSMKFQKEGFTVDNYNLPHVDYLYPHRSIVFYLNDSDGDTRLFDQWFNPNLGDPTFFSVQNKITPKANRLFYFNGLQYHTASNPIKHHKRVIVNINIDPL